MNNKLETKCPQCGGIRPAGARGELCPRCVAGFLQAAPTELSGANNVSAKTFTLPSLADLAPLFPQLEILELIGQGGMGAVYKARQKQLNRLVALKILPPGIGLDPAFAERFSREALALAQLNHPGIVTLYESGQVQNASSAHLEASPSAPPSVTTGAAAAEAACPAMPLYFFLMEFVDGVNLQQLLAGGRVSPREALAIVPQICDALQYAHDAGIVHRDIKPENILIDRRGRVKVADFGLAKIVDSQAELPPGLVASPDGSVGSLTDIAKVLGTPHYMSPEQVAAPGEVDHRADIYALGVVFYQMLTGELPGKRIEPPSTKVRIDVRLDEVVLRALESQPDRRYQQISEVKTMVETIAATPESGVPPQSTSATKSEREPWFTFCVTVPFAGTVLGGLLCQLVLNYVRGEWLVGTFLILALLTPLLGRQLHHRASRTTRLVWFRAGA